MSETIKTLKIKLFKEIHRTPYLSQFWIAQALFFLATCPLILISQYNQEVANDAAIYAYYFLVIGVIIRLTEHLMDNRLVKLVENHKRIFNISKIITLIIGTYTYYLVLNKWLANTGIIILVILIVVILYNYFYYWSAHKKQIHIWH